MVQPSISQHRSPKVARMRSFCSVGETNWSPETTRPSRTLMSGATAAAAAHAASKGRYGSRKIKASPGRSGVTVSRRRVCRIMRENGLVDAYGRKRFKVHPGAVNEADVPNVAARGFGGRAPRTHICSDLTYVRVGPRGTTSACSSTSTTGRSSATPQDRGGMRELRAKLSDYSHWYNNFRIHSTLGYMSPVEFREAGPSLPESSK